ncbi:hypothetical protein E9993_06935 [Labilibacter sediminis]|nr:hypothetical protein E9993_06935 [Labilibacter sediminis]
MVDKQKYSISFMSTYKVKKAIHQYSLVDLLEIKINPEHPEYNAVVKELGNRTPSKQEFEIAKKGLKIRLEVRNKPLSTFDKINCFLVPFTTRSEAFSNSIRDMNNKFESDLEEFAMYGETRKVEELKKWQKYARITYFIALPIIAFFWIIVKSVLTE